MNTRLVCILAALILAGCGDQIAAGNLDTYTEESLGEALSTDDDDLSDLADDERVANAVHHEKMFGLGVDLAVALASPHYADLKANWHAGAFTLRTARDVRGMDRDGHLHPENFDQYVQTVTSAGLAPVIAFDLARSGGPCGYGADGKPHACVVISHPTFRARFWYLLRHFPQVKGWAPTNEPDVNNYGTNAAQNAAHYFIDAVRVLRRCQALHKCAGDVQLVAGEFATFHHGFIREYADTLLREVRSRQHPQGRLVTFPRIWSLHPYDDTTTGNTTVTDEYLRFLDGLEGEARLPSGALRVWLDESGTFIQGGVRGCNYPTNGDADAQYHGAQAVFAFARKSRVDRVYWWQFQQANCWWGGMWDTGMADLNDVPRPAFCALVGRPASACGGSYILGRDCGSNYCPPR
jgi:hypothetical protein